MHSTSLKRFNNKRAFIELIAIVSLLFISKAPFALHFIRAVCDLVTLAQYKMYQQTLREEKNFNYPKALDTLLAANYATILIPGIQPYSTKLPLSEVAANIVISNFIYAAADHLDQSSSKRYNDPKHCNEEVTLQAFKFYDLSMIIRLVHLVLRDLPNLITYTTISYYVNNYID
ncbi:hypothetical protein HBI34_215970 [Parastagonospora nodorum]|nr:hypothetical protein HBI34_215970 [Parastagonospora nodorum]